MSKKIKFFFFFLIAKIFGYTFKIVQNDNELDIAKELRFKIYSAENYIDSELYPEKKLTDKYEPHSVSFVAYHFRKPVGTVRLVKDSEFGFPTENLFNIPKAKDRENTMEISRLGVLPKYRSKLHRFVMYGLAIIIFKYSLDNGVKYWIANMPDKLTNSFKKFGAEFEKIKEDQPTPYNLEQRKIIQKYFQRFELKPVMLDLRNVK